MCVQRRGRRPRWQSCGHSGSHCDRSRRSCTRRAGRAGHVWRDGSRVVRGLAGPTIPVGRVRWGILTSTLSALLDTTPFPPVYCPDHARAIPYFRAESDQCISFVCGACNGVLAKRPMFSYEAAAWALDQPVPPAAPVVRRGAKRKATKPESQPESSYKFRAARGPLVCCPECGVQSHMLATHDQTCTRDLSFSFRDRIVETSGELPVLTTRWNRRGETIVAGRALRHKGCE